MNGNISEVQNSIKETQEQAAEHRDKEHRRNNVILYKVNESDLQRAENRNKAHISFCLQLFNNSLNAGIAENDLVNVFRVSDERITHPDLSWSSLLVKLKKI